ncbi:hypothetical protein [Rhizobium sp.]
MTDITETTGIRVWHVLLALLSLALMLAGGIFYVWVVIDYLEDDSPFVDLQMLGWMFGLFSAGTASIGLLLAGVLLRLIPWRNAPRASLAVAIVSLILTAITYWVFSDLDHARYGTELLILRAACILHVLIIALPPFLHWLKAGRAPAIALRS